MKASWSESATRKEVVAPLSVIVSAFAPVSDARKTLTPQLRTDCGDTDLMLIDLGCGKNRLGGSALAQVYDAVGDVTPDVVDAADRQFMQFRVGPVDDDLPIARQHGVPRHQLVDGPFGELGVRRRRRGVPGERRPRGDDGPVDDGGVQPRRAANH